MTSRDPSPKDIAVQAVLDAGKLLQEKIDSVKTISHKTSRQDIVTDIDIEAEKILIDAIQSNFPSHSILSEEAGVIPKGSNYEWIIDPIDGTMNYAHGQPPYRVALCLMKDGEAILSVMAGPHHNQLFVAEKGKGTTLNGKPIHCSDNAELGGAIFMTHLSSKKEPRRRTIQSLEKIFTQTSQVRIYGSGLASMCYVAEGKYDIFYNVQTKPWDILPGVLLIEEAGGTVTDIEGKKITTQSTSVLATNGRLHNEMLALLADI